MWDEWVLDASMSRVDDEGRFLCFCPITAEGNIITGMNYAGTYPPGRLVGIVHEDGQQAVEDWCEEHADVLADLEREHEAKT